MNLEHELLTPRIEVRRLSTIRRARREVIPRTNRDLRLLLVVPIQITEYQIERAVGILLPALEHRCHIVAGVVTHASQLRNRRLRGRTDRQHAERDRQSDRNTNRTGRWPHGLLLLLLGRPAGAP